MSASSNNIVNSLIHGQPSENTNNNNHIINNCLANNSTRRKAKSANQQWIIIRSDYDGSIHSTVCLADSKSQAIKLGMRSYVEEFVSEEDNNDFDVQRLAQGEGEIWSAFKLQEMMNGNFVEILKSGFKRRNQRY